MSQPPSITLHVLEGTESDGQEPSPDNERALHTSFHQLILEQSSLIEAGLELEMEERDRESPACLAPPDACAAAWAEPGQCPGYSSTSLQILASMPSRTIGRSLGAIISQYCNRTARLRRRSSRPPLQQLCRAARPSLRQYDLETDPASTTLEDKRSLLVKELLSLSPYQRSQMLLTLPISLAEKRTLRRQVNRQRGILRQRAQHWAPSSPCGWSTVYISLVLSPQSCRGLWYRLLSLLRTAQPWHYTLKQISGRFGSSVLSYFLFLKTLLMFNFFSFLILLAFVVALQAVYPPTSASPPPFTGLELLTGAGYFTHSLLYYGYYSNITLNEPCSPGLKGSTCPLTAPSFPYNMPLAYLFSVGASFLVTCILLMYCVFCSFRESVGSSVGDLAIKVFCAWDFKVIQRRSVKLRCENFCTQLKELLAEQRSRSHSQSLYQRLRHCIVVLLAWTLTLGSVLGCTLAVHHFSKYMHVVQQEQRVRGSGRWQQEAILLVLPFVVSLLNALMPHLYNLLAVWEKHDSPVTQVYVAIFRNLILKMVVLSLLCFQWLSRSIVCSTEEAGHSLRSTPAGRADAEAAAAVLHQKDQPDAKLPVPQQALASIAHEHHFHHPAVLPLLPGCNHLPLLHHLVGTAIRNVRTLPGAGNRLQIREELGASAAEVQPQHHVVHLGPPAPGGEHLPPILHVCGPASCDLLLHPSGERPAEGHLPAQGADRQGRGR
ncbi:transmembrane channel-like protein 6 isoform X7 [Myiozetetes cayanensis]|uniref:transmembrane channel-like protein 6 isoform X7 n=1 Tax=Myiozetetes cayanensis TaxID=478635 RepID=UPI00215EC8D4|nr:transmembrane channel-like protein 6 isoform X7 [Myiozetetes cayanensis]